MHHQGNWQIIVASGSNNSSSLLLTIIVVEKLTILKLGSYKMTRRHIQFKKDPTSAIKRKIISKLSEL